MNVKETFLKLTRHTYPHGQEHNLFDLLPQNLDMDDFGNLFIKIGESDTMFTSHLDTATSAYTPVNHVIEDNIIKTDGKSILGADDKAGVTIMLYMIEKGIPGLYYFFLGEEVGCVGSSELAKKHKLEKLPYINKVVSFDRRGTDSIITFQASSRCCSEEFAKALADQLNLVDPTFKYENDPTGIYTDSEQFVSIYPECTNISVGYYNEHTFREEQDIEHLTKLAQAVTKVDWNSLPVERDPSVVEYSSYSWGSFYSKNRYSTYDDFWDDDFQPTQPKEIKSYFYDSKYDFVGSYIVDRNGEYLTVDIDPMRLDDEREDIHDFITQIEIEYSYMKWDGVKLVITLGDGRTTKTSRNELIEYLPHLDLSTFLSYENDLI